MIPDRFLIIWWELLFLAQFFTYIFHWRAGKISSFLTQLTLILNVFSFIFVCYFLLIFPKEKRKFIFKKLLPPIFFTIFAFFSFFWSIDKPRTLFWNTFSLTAFFSSIFIAVSIKDAKEFILTTAKLISFLGFFSCLFTLFLLFLGKVEFKDGFFLQKISFGFFEVFQLIDPSFPSFAPHSFFSNKNFFAFFLFVSGFFTFFLYFVSQNFTFLFSFLFQFFFLLLTYSRASLLSFFSAFLFFFFLLFLKKIKISTSFLFLISFSLLSFFVSFLLTPNSWLRSLEGFHQRVPLWKTAIDSWKENPFFGKGFDTSYKINLEINGYYLSFHNTFLNILAELGIIGFFIFLVCWFYPLSKGIFNFRKEKNIEKILFLALLFSLEIGFLVQSFFETRIFYHFTSLVWSSSTFLFLHPFFAKTKTENL